MDKGRAPVLLGDPAFRCLLLGYDHTQAESRQTQPSRLSAGRVCEPQVGQAIGAPILSSWVASAESSGAARRGRRVGTFLPNVMDSPEVGRHTCTVR